MSIPLGVRRKIAVPDRPRIWLISMVCQDPTWVFNHSRGWVFDRTKTPCQPFEEGTATVAAGEDATAGSWVLFCTDTTPAVYGRYRVIVDCDNSWLGLRSTVYSRAWTRPCDVGGSPGYTWIFTGLVLKSRGS